MTDLAPVGRGKPAAELTVDDLPTYPPTLWGLLEQRAAATPDRVLLEDDTGRTMTAAQWRDTAEQVAAALYGRGITAETPVSWQLPTTHEAAVLLLALARLGAVENPIIPILRQREVGFIVGQTGARLLITPSVWRNFDYGALARDVADVHGCETLVLDRGGLPLGDPSVLPPPPTGDGDPVRHIFYSSGTTADPKGVVHTHRTIGCEVRQLSGHQAMRDRPSLVGAPVGHAIGMLGGLMCPLVGGKPLFLIDGWDPPTVLRAMVEEQIAAGSGSTYFFTSLLDCPGFGPEHVELMRYIGLGGSPIPNAVAERADELGISLVRAYGCTEHPSVTGSEHTAPREKRIHTDGCPLEWVEIRTVDEDGRDVGIGLPGEILTRG
ncbi:MAG TPA: AMP-binding protein, partial [Acidimicrobiales bacterium]|nr:AMP-binding protein [Acidimicrobiales bacterium]